jgi:hypothetical protein
MKYWLTTHWPPREDEATECSLDIWLPDERESPGADISPNDLVVVYESLTGRTLLRKKPNGVQERVHCQRGKGGVVCIGRVQSSLVADEDILRANYADKTSIWWQWHAQAEVLSRSGFVPRHKLASILGYNQSYTFRGFGTQHSGLRELSEEEFNTIRKRFKESQPIHIHDYPHISFPRSSEFGGGESNIHRELKEYVAADPSHVLNEQGLSTLRIEYNFASGDRADIVLVDQYNRIVGVEIEREVTAIDEAGALQAIKYRYMLEWSTNRAPGDSRAFLIAHKIDSATKKKCTKYGVEYYEIPREKVKKHNASIALRKVENAGSL